MHLSLKRSNHSSEATLIGNKAWRGCKVYASCHPCASVPIRAIAGKARVAMVWPQRPIWISRELLACPRQVGFFAKFQARLGDAPFEVPLPFPSLRLDCLDSEVGVRRTLALHSILLQQACLPAHDSAPMRTFGDCPATPLGHVRLSTRQPLMLISENVRCLRLGREICRSAVLPA